MSSRSLDRWGWSSASLCTTGRQLIEERIDELARLLPAVEAAPQHPQTADELVAGIDRDEIAIGLLILAHSHKQRLDALHYDTGAVDRFSTLNTRARDFGRPNTWTAK